MYVRSATRRFIAVLLPFDLAFAGVALLAWAELVGAREAGLRSQVLSYGALAAVVRVLTWLSVAVALLRPVERWLNGATTQVGAAARALYRFPRVFALLFSLLWGGSYAVLTAIHQGQGPLGSALALAGGLFAGATVLAALPFVWLWAEVLLAREQARVHAIAPPSGLRRPALPLRARVMLLALALTLAPTLWLLAMGHSLAAHSGAGLGDAHGWMLGLFVTAIGMWAPVCGWLLLRTLAAPIARIAATAEAVGHDGAGGADPVPILSPDELGLLAEGTNRMIDRLDAELERRAAVAAENEQLYRAACAAVETRDRFLSVASHELRGPLGTLAMNLQLVERLVERGAATEELLERLQVGTAQARRLASLIDALLDVSRMETQSFVRERRDVDLGALVRDVATRMEPELARAGCDLQLECPSPVPVVGDPLALEQVVTNLVGNAIRFGRGKPLHLTVRSHQGRAELRVRDQGPGIPLEDQGRIFERYERTEGDIAHAGLGLGLFLVREIVREHGGEVRVESRPGAGATFIVDLALAERPSQVVAST